MHASQCSTATLWLGPTRPPTRSTRQCFGLTTHPSCQMVGCGSSQGTWAGLPSRPARSIPLAGRSKRPFEFLKIKIKRSEEHTSELQSLMRISYAVLCLKKKHEQYTNTKRSTEGT